MSKGEVQVLCYITKMVLNYQLWIGLKKLKFLKGTGKVNIIKIVKASGVSLALPTVAVTSDEENKGNIVANVHGGIRFLR